MRSGKEREMEEGKGKKKIRKRKAKVTGNESNGREIKEEKGITVTGAGLTRNLMGRRDEEKFSKCKENERMRKEKCLEC